MKPPNPMLAGNTDALGAVLRLWAIVSRPIPCPHTRSTTTIGD
jgi:hypothetical protein